MKYIYLDSRFWIDIGDNELTNRNSSIKTFYTLLKELVYTRKAICPISNPIFLELLKQMDNKQKKSIARIMDELSLGYCLESKYYLFKREIENLILEKSSYWVTPVDFRDLEENRITERPEGKRILEMTGRPSIEEIIEVLSGINWDNFKGNISTINEYLQNQKQINESEITDFSHLQMNEIYNTFMSVVDIFPELSYKIEQLEDIPDMSNILYKLPSIWAFGSIHALIRYDRNRKYRINDFFDIDHCSMAIGYYDYFFTERSFFHVVTDGLAQLDTTFNTICCRDYERGNSILYSIITST